MSDDLTLRDPERDEPSFFDDVLHVVKIDDHNSITLRVLTFEEQKKVARIVNANKNMTIPDASGVLAEKMIVAWDGPKFAGRPVTAENINKLPMHVVNLISEKIQEINAPLVALPSIE